MSKNILITGAYGGIGMACAKFLRNMHYTPVLLGKDKDKLNQFSSELGNVPCVVCDLSDLYEIEEVFLKLHSYGIKLDGMCHCAGLAPLMSVAENDIATMINTFNVNLLSFIELTKYFYLEKYSNPGSSIVAVSSVIARVASNRQTIYSASKAGLESAVRCISKEFISRKIRVNAIAPGVVETKMYTDLAIRSNADKEKQKNLFPLGIIPPENIAEAVEFLLSDKSRYMTGSCMTVDAGFMSWK